ncbi:MAG: acyltransferase [Isosphaeraceae bacterium]
MSALASDRNAELDALRGLAALAVVLFHTNVKWMPVGWAAVDLFFVLSGYLITTIILRNGRTKGFLLRFYVRRGLRVWPIYYLLVLIMAAAVPWLYRQYDWSGLLYVLTFTQGIGHYVRSPSPTFTYYLGHTWTLAIEEQFYLLWPALLLFVGLDRRRVAALGAICVIGSAVARWRGLPVSILGGRGDGLALGGILAAWLLDVSPRSTRAGRITWILAGLGALATAGLIALALGTGLDTAALRTPAAGPIILALSLLFSAIVGIAVCQTGNPWLSPLRAESLRQLGEMSYGLYLYHMPILLLAGDIARAFGRRGAPLWRHALALGICFAVARLSWLYVESPVLRLKDRFAYRPTPPREPAPINGPVSMGSSSRRGGAPEGRSAVRQAGR